MAPSVAEIVPSAAELGDIAKQKLNRAFDAAQHTTVS